jgi:hypothetical protein
MHFTYDFSWIKQLLPRALSALKVEAGETEELQLDSRWSQGLQVLDYFLRLLCKLLLVLIVFIEIFQLIFEFPLEAMF